MFSFFPYQLQVAINLLHREKFLTQKQYGKASHLLLSESIVKKSKEVWQITGIEMNEVSKSMVVAL